MNETIELLQHRRSVKAINLLDPGPDSNELEDILKCAMRVPDHGKLTPWRFLGIGRNSALQLDKKLQDIAPESKNNSGILARAPFVLVVVFSPKDHPKIPIEEQLLSAGACCQNILVATHALGYRAQWLTEWYSRHSAAKALFGLAEHESFAGFIYMGSFAGETPDRVRPELSALYKKL